jgi:hypothetical protein
MPRDAELPRHNLVFGGVAKTHDHDAVMRISGESPGQRDHSVERQKPGTSRGTPPRRITIGHSPCRWRMPILPLSNLPRHQPAARSITPSEISPMVV